VQADPEDSDFRLLSDLAVPAQEPSAPPGAKEAGAEGGGRRCGLSNSPSLCFALALKESTVMWDNRFQENAWGRTGFTWVMKVN
jgi:hypothetical protein